MAAHPCTAKGCTTTVGADRLMCPRHWSLVPADLKLRVWATYRPGQSAGSATPEWFIAADAAIAAVARLERKGQKYLPGIG